MGECTAGWINGWKDALRDSLMDGWTHECVSHWIQQVIGPSG